MSTFLTKLERQAWLAFARRDPALVSFGRLLDDLCETALEQTGKELPAEHAVVILLRDAAEGAAGEGCGGELLAA